jgi:hypothetical protein
MSIEKEAQERSIFNRMYGALNLTKHLRKLWSSRYSRLISYMEYVDNRLRQVAVHSTPNIRKLLHMARMAHKRYQTPSVMLHAYQAMELMKKIFSSDHNQIEKFIDLRNKTIEEFYKHNMNVNKQDLAKMHQALYQAPEPAAATSAPAAANPSPEQPNIPRRNVEQTANASKERAQLISEAKGLTTQVWEGLRYGIPEIMPTQRGFEGGVLSGVSGDSMRQQVESADDALNLVQSIFDSMTAVFNQLDEERAKGEVDAFIKTLTDFKNTVDNADKEIKTVYNKHFATLISGLSGQTPGAESTPTGPASLETQPGVELNPEGGEIQLEEQPEKNNGITPENINKEVLADFRSLIQPLYEAQALFNSANDPNVTLTKYTSIAENIQATFEDINHSDLFSSGVKALLVPGGKITKLDLNNLDNITISDVSRQILYILDGLKKEFIPKILVAFGNEQLQSDFINEMLAGYDVWSLFLKLPQEQDIKDAVSDPVKIKTLSENIIKDNQEDIVAKSMDYIRELISLSHEYVNTNKGLSIRLLCEASEMCEKIGMHKQSEIILKQAQRI